MSAQPDERAGKPPPESLGETSLHVRRAKAGDKDDVAWVVARFSPLLVAAASYRLGARLRSICDPEDVAAEVWAVALPRLAGLPARDGRYTPVFLKFLTTSLGYVISNLVQKHVAGKPEILSPHDTESQQRPRMLDTLPADTAGVITAAVRRETRDAVRAAIEELSPDDREIVILRGIEQKSNREAASLVGVEPGTAAVRYHRALARLREHLPGSVFEELADDG